MLIKKGKSREEIQAETGHSMALTDKTMKGAARESRHASECSCAINWRFNLLNVCFIKEKGTG